MVVQIQKDTNDLTKLKLEVEAEPVNQIGFVIPSEEEDDELDDNL